MEGRRGFAAASTRNAGAGVGIERHASQRDEGHFGEYGMGLKKGVILKIKFRAKFRRSKGEYGRNVSQKHGWNSNPIFLSTKHQRGNGHEAMEFYVRYMEYVDRALSLGFFSLFLIHTLCCTCTYDFFRKKIPK